MATLADYGPEVRAEVKQVREVVATLHEQLIKWNLVVWTAGNVSQRLHTADLMVIKPSGLRYEYLTPSSMVVCDLDGNVVDGSEAPSSDTAAHAYIYRHMPDVYGVVHTHSTYATAWAATGQNIPCGLTMMGDEFGGPVPVGPFRLIGSEAIGEGVVETLREYPKSPAVLMQNHGPFTIGKDAESAVKAKGSCAETFRGGMSAVDLRKTLYRNSESKKSRCLRLRIFLAARTSRRWTTAATTNAIVTMHTRNRISSSLSSRWRGMPIHERRFLMPSNRVRANSFVFISVR